MVTTSMEKFLDAPDDKPFCDDNTWEEPESDIDFTLNLEALFGASGSGKTYAIRERLAANPRYAVLTATTGVAAINMGDGVTTVHSQMKFFDLDSLKRSLREGWLKWSFVGLARRGVRYLIIDEISMFSADALDCLYAAAKQARDWIFENRDNRAARGAFGLTPVGLLLVGDYCQLPPVEGTYAFHAKCWSEFKVEKLTTNYRQSDPVFLQALNAARKGRGAECVTLLRNLNVQFVPVPIDDFDGTSLFPINNQVDKRNRECLAKIDAPEICFDRHVWGKEKGEWKNIPERLIVKEGARVMVLVNQPKEFKYVNGDMGVILPSARDTRTNWREVTDGDGERICVPDFVNTNFELADNSSLPLTIRRGFDCRVWGKAYCYTFVLDKVVQSNYQDREPEGLVVNWEGPDYSPHEEDPDFWIRYYNYIEKVRMGGVPYLDPVKGAWVVGEVEYMPVRLGYALTVHKVQGLTLDRVQLDCRNLMARKPGLMYVAMSRVRSPEGLVIVGSPSLLAERIIASSECKEWF